MTDQHAASEALDDAWDALDESLPPRWHIGKPSLFATRLGGDRVGATAGQAQFAADCHRDRDR